MAKVIHFYKSEYDLAKALQKGDETAFTSFYEKYSGLFLSICYRYVGDLTIAEDLMVESIMKIFEKVGQFKFDGSFEGWSKRIIVNESLMFLRKRKMIKVDIEQINLSSFSYEDPTNLEAEQILEIIKELPIGYRTVFNLYAIEGYSHAEIAKQLSISEGTSKSQLSRARAMLQENIKKNESIGYSINKR